MKMRAIVYEKFGPPEVLQIKEVEKPVPKENEVLIKIMSTSVHRGDTRMRSLDIPVPGWQKIMARLFLGIRKPRRSVLGMELAGEIEAVGKNVSLFKIGDHVFGSTVQNNMGAYAEYKCMPENSLLALKPTNLSFEEAATVPNGAFTALCIIKQANIKSGQKILIYGASGSVGTFAVQFAKNLGGIVTGVCSTPNVEMVKSLGADKVVDYKRENFSQSGEIYNVIFDAVGKFSPKEAKRALKEGGIYLNVHTASNKCKFLPEALEEIKDIIEAKKLRTIVDKQFKFEEIVEAHRYVDKGHKKGNVVIIVQK